MFAIVKHSPNIQSTYIGRPSPLGNPFPIGKSKFSNEIYSLDESLKLYKEWLERKIVEDQQVIDALNEIALRVMAGERVLLSCWCKDELKPSPKDKPRCHGDIIRELVNLKIAEYKQRKGIE